MKASYENTGHTPPDGSLDLESSTLARWNTDTSVSDSFSLISPIPNIPSLRTPPPLPAKNAGGSLFGIHRSPASPFSDVRSLSYSLNATNTSSGSFLKSPAQSFDGSIELAPRTSCSINNTNNGSFFNTPPTTPIKPQENKHDSSVNLQRSSMQTNTADKDTSDTTPLISTSLPQSDESDDSIHRAYTVIITFLEEEIKKIQENRGASFFLFYSLPATLNKLDAFENALFQLQNKEICPKTLAGLDDVVSKLANNKDATNHRNFFGFGASSSKRNLTALDLVGHQEALKKILEAELKKIAEPLPNPRKLTPKMGCLSSLFYSREKTEIKITAVKDALKALQTPNQSIKSFNRLIQDLLKNTDLCQHRSCGFFGRHIGDSSTKQQLTALAKKVAQGVTLADQLFAKKQQAINIR